MMHQVLTRRKYMAFLEGLGIVCGYPTIYNRVCNLGSIYSIYYCFCY